MHIFPPSGREGRRVRQFPRAGERFGSGYGGEGAGGEEEEEEGERRGRGGGEEEGRRTKGGGGEVEEVEGRRRRGGGNDDKLMMASFSPAGEEASRDKVVYSIQHYFIPVCRSS